MTDFSFFINSAYGLSGIGLILTAGLSYRAMKRNESEAATLRRRRRQQKPAPIADTTISPNVGTKAVTEATSDKAST